MAAIPSTSVTLLTILGSDAMSTRWGEFARRYLPMMRAYCNACFPSVDADDMIQETLISLVAALPHYTYEPDEKGHFHNYLTGILRHKGLTALRKRKREERLTESFQMMGDLEQAASGNEELEFRHAAYELALRELLADPDVQSRTKQVFIQVAVNGEKPERVAEAFGLTRNSVDQMKSRMIAKLKAIISRLKPEDAPC